MRRTTSLVLGVSLASAMVVGRAQAAPDIKVSLPDSDTFATQLGTTRANLESQVSQRLSDVFQSARVGDYLRSLADAQAFTTRGMGADYASNFKAVMVGVAGNAAFNVDKGVGAQNEAEKPPVAGVSSNVTFMAGLNLGLIGIDGLTVYGNYFQWKGSFDQFDTEMRNWGAHAQLKLFGPGEEKLLNALIRWGGFDITTGIEYAHLKLSLSDRWQRNVSVGAGAASDPYVAVNASGVMSIDMNTMSIPLELTTNLRLLYFLALYGGLGFDWQIGGQSDMAIAIEDKEIHGRIPSQNVDARIGAANVTATESAKPSAGRMRLLVGVQLNVLFLKLFTQVNVITASPAIASLAFGARVAF
jgi:hypothetical protein